MLDIYFYIYYEYVSGLYYLSCSEYEDGLEIRCNTYDDVLSYIEYDKVYFSDQYSGRVLFHLMEDSDDEVYI